MDVKLIQKRHLSTVLLTFFFILTFISAEVPEKSPNTEWWKELKTVESSTVLLNNKADIIPLKNIAEMKIASLNIGSAYAAEFDSISNKYTKVESIPVAKYPASLNFDSLRIQLNAFSNVLIQLTDATVNDPEVLGFITELDREKQIVLVVYGNPNSLKNAESLSCPIIWTSANSPASSNFTAQLIFGGTAAVAKLDKDVSVRFKKGDGYLTSAIRLKYTVPEEIGINSADLEQPIDKIIAEALAQKATPGAAVMVVKDGKVILNKAYGTHTYQSADVDKIDDIFDLASVTKISATTIAAMRLFEQEKINLEENLGAYLPAAGSTTKRDVKIKELLLHEAGLTPFIPFYSSLKPGDYSPDSSSFYSVKVADGYYLRSNYYEDIMLPRMLNTRLQNRGKYEYSDLSMYFMKEVIEHQAKQRLDEYVSAEFYRPLGMRTAGFNPRNRFEKSKIIPTEQDTYFRKTLLEGFVHDQGAAMAGGIAGHAGLFASTNDLAILFQMMLNKGTYGGIRYFKPNTITLFTSKQSATSRRGLGFDRWDPETKTYPSNLASPETFGHTGYTGTCVWVDPKYNLIYIFLSNRVHPQVSNKLSSLRVRARIQDVIYQAIQKAGV